MTLTLTRDVPVITSYGTTGVLRGPGSPDWLTLENPWINNTPFVSCIPTGLYKIVRDTTGKHKYFRLIDVPNRTDIELHRVGTIADLSGCIGLALKRRFQWEVWYYMQSKAAMVSFMDYMRGVDEAELVIQWATPKPWEPGQ